MLWGKAIGDDNLGQGEGAGQNALVGHDTAPLYTRVGSSCHQITSLTFHLGV